MIKVIPKRMKRESQKLKPNLNNILLRKILSTIQKKGKEMMKKKMKFLMMNFKIKSRK